MSAASGLTAREILHGLRWYVREISGESAYDRYLEAAHRDHPGAAVLDRNAFERARQDHRDLHPPQRCC